MNEYISIQKLQDLYYLSFSPSAVVVPPDARSLQMMFSSLIKYNRLAVSYRIQASYFSPHITNKFTFKIYIKINTFVIEMYVQMLHNFVDKWETSLK